MQAHHQRFQEGQHVACLDGEVVASSSALIISESAWKEHQTWDDACGGLDFSNHDPCGTTLFAADISVHPNFRCKGIAKRLYSMRVSLSKDLKLQRLGTVCRLPGLSLARSQNQVPYAMSYALFVNRGEIKDVTLTPLLKLGYALKGIKKNYLEDPESCDCGAILEMLF